MAYQRESEWGCLTWLEQWFVVAARRVFVGGIDPGAREASHRFLVQRGPEYADHRRYERRRFGQGENMERDHIMQFFAYDHLPAQLRDVSRPFGELAEHIHTNVPRNAERTVALRKLLEAKDAAVRAMLAQTGLG